MTTNNKPSKTASSNEPLKFTGGKFKGTPVCELPSDYLLFIRYQDKQFIKEAERILRERGDLPKPTLPRMEEIVVAGQQGLAKKYHPECGGTESEMKEVEAAADALLELIKCVK